MIKLRNAADIYHIEGGWFAASWHFSFDQYRDPEYMGFGPLRVFNDDRLVPGAVWPMHPHRDIEGITYVLDGLFEHADSLGNGGSLSQEQSNVPPLGPGSSTPSATARKTDRCGSFSFGCYRTLRTWSLPWNNGNTRSRIGPDDFSRCSTLKVEAPSRCIKTRGCMFGAQRWTGRHPRPWAGPRGLPLRH